MLFQELTIPPPHIANDMVDHLSPPQTSKAMESKCPLCVSRNKKGSYA
jgi:hypothetical protein